MAITLRPEHEAAIGRAVESGAYSSADEVIERALDALRSSDDWLRINRDLINEKIERADAQLARGEGVPGEVARARLDARKAAWLEQQKRG